MSNTIFGGIVLKEDEVQKIQDWSDLLSYCTTAVSIYKKMLLTKLEQLALLDAALNKAKEFADYADVTNQYDMDKFNALVGSKDDNCNIPGEPDTLWGIHAELLEEVNGKNGVSIEEDVEFTTSTKWEDYGLRNTIKLANAKIQEIIEDITKYIQEELQGASNRVNVGNDNASDQARINMLVKTLNALLIKYGKDKLEFEKPDFDIDDIESEDHPENMPDKVDTLPKEAALEPMQEEDPQSEAGHQGDGDTTEDEGHQNELMPE